MGKATVFVFHWNQADPVWVVITKILTIYVAFGGKWATYFRFQETEGYSNEIVVLSHLLSALCQG